MWMVGIIIVTVVLLYFVAIMPRMSGRPDYSPLMGSHYAHRGLHDNESNIPENSMAAFEKAVDAGYGIEMDVQLTKDRIPVVFHDETLKRICGAEGKVRDYTYEELQAFTLFSSQERIPLLSDVLKLVNGKVPLIIEIKVYEKASTVCSIADELIRKYKGAYCMESFHPLAIRWYRKHRSQVIRGQLSENFSTSKKREAFPLFLVHYLLLNFIGKPDFIAYNHLHKKNISRTLCQHLYQALGVTWTIRSQKELDEARDAFSMFIFEGFIPREE